MAWNNCYFYAKWRQYKYGDYVLSRPSKHSHWWPLCRLHYVVLPKKIGEQCPFIHSFVPDKDDLGKLPCPLFKGHIKKGDGD